MRESPHQLPANEHSIPRKYPPPFRQGRLWGREMRIATASVRTDLAMTGFPWSVVHGRRATARVAPTEGYKECLAGGRTGSSAPTDMWKRLRRAGLQEVRQNGPSGTPAPTEGYKGCGRRADVGIGPYRSITRGAMGGRPQGSPLRKRNKKCGGERNPPVTALPCQPPLGKGAEGTGDADCHSQCAH